MNPTPKGWPRISSAIFYDGAGKAIDWLCNAFGFEVQLKVEGEAGRIDHSELVYRGGLIMVAEADKPDKPHLRAPGQVGGGNTQNLFIYVDDVEAHCARARAAGGTIGVEPKISDYGDDYWSDKGYECIDPGGHHWWFAQRLQDGPGYAPRLDARDLGQPAPKGWPRMSACLYYDDASAAIDWLCRALGFEVQLKVEGEGGAIEHSELVLGGGLIMPGSATGAPERLPHCKSPRALGGANTQTLMLYVDDTAAACERARAAGAKITSEPQVSDYGEGYWADLCCGLEDIGGHHWWLAQRLRG